MVMIDFLKETHCLFYKNSSMATSYRYGGINFGGYVKISIGLLFTIAVYSFALEPEEHQPSGTCNFSRIDNAQL